MGYLEVGNSITLMRLSRSAFMIALAGGEGESCLGLGYIEYLGMPDHMLGRVYKIATRTQYRPGF
jgi:hypothetical protein